MIRWIPASVSEFFYVHTEVLKYAPSCVVRMPIFKISPCGVFSLRKELAQTLT
jgi:hypothetical protein